MAAGGCDACAAWNNFSTLQPVAALLQLVLQPAVLWSVLGCSCDRLLYRRCRLCCRAGELRCRAAEHDGNASEPAAQVCKHPPASIRQSMDRFWLMSSSGSRPCVACVCKAATWPSAMHSISHRMWPRQQTEQETAQTMGFLHRLVMMTGSPCSFTSSGCRPRTLRLVRRRLLPAAAPEPQDGGQRLPQPAHSSWRQLPIRCRVARWRRLSGGAVRRSCCQVVCVCPGGRRHRGSRQGTAVSCAVLWRAASFFWRGVAADAAAPAAASSVVRWADAHGWPPAALMITSLQR